MGELRVRGLPSRALAHLVTVPFTGGDMMNTQRLVSKFAISTLSLLALVLSNSAFAADGGRWANEIGSMGPVPKAECGPADHTESGLQGQTTSQERASGDSQTRLQLQSGARRPVPRGGGLFAGRAVVLRPLRLHGNG